MCVHARMYRISAILRFKKFCLSDSALQPLQLLTVVDYRLALFIMCFAPNFRCWTAIESIGHHVIRFCINIYGFFSC
jgi:hypothetical protein